MAAPHLWVALSPHGFGHAAMTAPVVAELRRRIPQLRLTLQTGVAADFLASRYDRFELEAEIADFGMRMHSSTQVDVAASVAAYDRLHAQFDHHVGRNRAMLAANRPDLLLSNVACVPLAAAAAEGVAALALSSLNWADLYAHYLGAEAAAVPMVARMRDAYHSARAFLRCTPSQAMTLDNQREIGPIARIGRADRDGLRRRLGLPPGAQLGMIAFGGIRHDLGLHRWPRLPGWSWLVHEAPPPGRDDMRDVRPLGMDFPDLVASVDVVVTKPGYGTFGEAAMVGTPVLYVIRPDWPETPHLDTWLANHTRSIGVPEALLPGDDLANLLRKLFSLPPQQVAQPTGIGDAADIIEDMLLGRS